MKFKNYIILFLFTCFQISAIGQISKISLQEELQEINSAEKFSERIINLIEQNNKKELLQLSTKKLYCYLCFDNTPTKKEPLINKKTFYTDYFDTIFNQELLSRLKRDEKRVFISNENKNIIMMLYTTYQNNEFGDGHEGTQFVFWFKKENNELKINGFETIP